MPIILNELKIPLTADASSLSSYAARALALSQSSIRSLRVVRISLDARKKSDIFFRYALELELSPKEEKRLLAKGNLNILRAEEFNGELSIHPGAEEPRGAVIVVGLGPAGLFAAHLLAEYGYKPIVIERGKAISERKADVERFWSEGTLDEESNLMYGEGGAGSFSDGKLTTRIKDGRVHYVLSTLANFGAPEEIRVMAKPHVGTDRLAITVENMRKSIVSMGGEIRFGTRFEGLLTEAGELKAIRVKKNGMEERIPCCACILGIGQGARDTYRRLHEEGIELSPKPFAVGVRIEHPRTMIDKAQYGEFAGHPRLGAAEYRISAQAFGRGVYSFCMCPGGLVVASSSSEGEVVTNGMSYYARDAENSNAAIVVQVDSRDYGTDPLEGLRFQEELEHRAYHFGGGGYAAPASRLADFLSGDKPRGFGTVNPSYRPGVTPCDLRKVLPDFVSAPLKEAFADFGRKIRDFDMGDAVMTAAETRTSSPVRILRDENGEATRCKGLYPVGEGAGYAGGIVSAAVDGLKAAERVIARFKPEN